MMPAAKTRPARLARVALAALPAPAAHSQPV